MQYTITFFCAIILIVNEAVFSNTNQSAPQKLNNFVPKILLSAHQAIHLLSRLLIQMNNELGKLEEQTAYLATELAMHDESGTQHSFRNTFFLSLVHLIGFHKFYGEQYIDIQNCSSDKNDEHKCYIYSYSYLKFMSPLKDFSKALLFFDKPYNEDLAQKVPELETASLIFTAQKIILMLRNTNFNYTQEDLNQIDKSSSQKKYLEIFKKIDKSKEISNNLKSQIYKSYLSKWNDTFKWNEQETNQIIKMLIFVMDFKSTHTVNHTINTANFSATMGLLCNCQDEQINQIFTGALLHDLGKMAIPESILESSTSLTKIEFTLMKTHADYTIKLLQNIIPENIFNIAVRHHEKLDGSGYPLGLSEKDLTIQERIVAICDIISALVDSRSYKKELPKEKVINICKEMAYEEKIDFALTNIMIENFDFIRETASKLREHLVAPLGNVEKHFQEELNFESLTQTA